MKPGLSALTPALTCGRHTCIPPLSGMRGNEAQNGSARAGPPCSALLAARMPVSGSLISIISIILLNTSYSFTFHWEISFCLVSFRSSSGFLPVVNDDTTLFSPIRSFTFSMSIPPSISFCSASCLIASHTSIKNVSCWQEASIFVYTRSYSISSQVCKSAR